MMLKIIQFCMLFIIVFVFVLFSSSSGAGYPGFIKLNENDCVVLNENDCVVLNENGIQRLPQPWHKYKGFVKICELKKNMASKAKVSIISIWAYDYLDAWTKTSKWEDFPLTIIVDDHFNQLGTFPELYPMDSRTEPIVYYGKWKTGMPTEIRLDVYNPTVTGDYYYEPLIWNKKDGQYHMKSMESKSGQRPK